MRAWLSIPLAAIVVALVAPRRGVVRQSAYFKVNGKCMVKPFPDVPAQEIDCATWEREREFEERDLIGGEKG